MLHILLMILKIIGIILLSILSLILLLLLIVLFVPIRYRVQGKKDEDDLSGRARISWLFGLISMIVLYEQKKMILQCKVLGIDILKMFKKKEKKPSKKIKQKPEKTVDKIEKIEDTKTNNEPDIEILSGENKTVENEKKSFIDRIKDVCSKILSFPAKIKDSVEKIRLTITNICDKIKYWKDFISDERIKGALSVVKKQLFRIIRHILPKKLKGQLTYGFEDPCTTGQVLAGISVIYPLYYKKLSIYPDFSRQIFAGDVDLKGRLYVVYLLICGLTILFNKNIQFIISTFRNKEDSNNGKQ